MSSTTAQTDATFDVEKLRGQFFALADGTAYFDGPGGSQTPRVVAEAIADTLAGPLSNRGSCTRAERNAEEAVSNGRAALADLIGCAPDDVIFGRSMTALTFDLARTLAKQWGPGDEIVVSRLDHDGNVRPWVIAAQNVGATIRWADFDPETAELDPAQISAVVNDRTRLVAVTAASNLIGTMPDLPAISQIVHSVGALFFVDGVHFTAHAPVDRTALGADFFACSPYKFLGPHCGAIAGRAEILESLSPDKLLPASDRVPEKFELGTLPYELMAGTAAAVDFIASIVDGEGSRRERLHRSMRAVEQHEDALRLHLEEQLYQLPGVSIRSRAKRRTPTLLITFDGHDPADIQRYLAERNINAPAGSFYAYEAAQRLGLGTTGGLRVGFAPYNNQADVDRLVDALTAYLG